MGVIVGIAVVSGVGYSFIQRRNAAAAAEKDTFGDGKHKHRGALAPRHASSTGSHHNSSASAASYIGAANKRGKGSSSRDRHRGLVEEDDGWEAATAVTDMGTSDKKSHHRSGSKDAKTRSARSGSKDRVDRKGGKSARGSSKERTDKKERRRSVSKDRVRKDKTRESSKGSRERGDTVAASEPLRPQPVALVPSSGQGSSGMAAALTPASLQRLQQSLASSAGAPAPYPHMGMAPSGTVPGGSIPGTDTVLEVREEMLGEIAEAKRAKEARKSKARQAMEQMLQLLGPIAEAEQQAVSGGALSRGAPSGGALSGGALSGGPGPSFPMAQVASSPRASSRGAAPMSSLSPRMPAPPGVGNRWPASPNGSWQARSADTGAPAAPAPSQKWFY